jgi:hypothetical protein
MDATAENTPGHDRESGDAAPAVGGSRSEAHGTIFPRDGQVTMEWDGGFMVENTQTIGVQGATYEGLVPAHWPKAPHFRRLTVS